jgi:two-component system nitrate/nitrite response regulator NarL
MTQPGAAPQATVVPILVADRTPMGTCLLADTLRRDRHFEVSTAFSSREVCEQLERQPGAVLLVSTELDQQSADGFLLLRRLRADRPEVRAIMLLDAPRRELVVEAFRSGANGIFCRVDPIQTLRKCIYRVYAGEIWASNQQIEFVLQVLRETMPLRLVDGNGQNLLEREWEIIECVAGGLSNREIADRLQLSEHTIKNNLSHIYHKLGVSTRAEVILYAYTCRREQKTRSEEDLPVCFPGDGVQEIRELAEQGFAVPQFLLAKRYRDGAGVGQDALLAYTWFLVAELICAELSRRSRRERQLLRSKLDAEQIKRAQAAGLERVCKALPQIDPDMQGEADSTAAIAYSEPRSREVGVKKISLRALSVSSVSIQNSPEPGKGIPPAQGIAGAAPTYFSSSPVNERNNVS